MAVAYLLFLLLALVLGRERGLPFSLTLDAALLGSGLSLVVGAGIVVVLRETILEDLGGSWSFAQIAVLPCALALYFSRHPVTRGRVLSSLDIFVPPLLLAQTVIRIGCFSAGCCHGKPAWGVPWAIVVDDPLSATLYRGIPVHPTQLYQIIANLLALAVVLALRKRPRWQGKLLWVYLLLYGFGRFVVEFYRGDLRPMLGPLSLNQAVCLLFIAIGSAGLRGWLSARLWSNLGQRLWLMPQRSG